MACYGIFLTSKIRMIKPWALSANASEKKLKIEKTVSAENITELLSTFEHVKDENKVTATLLMHIFSVFDQLFIQLCNSMIFSSTLLFPSMCHCGIFPSLPLFGLHLYTF